MTAPQSFIQQLGDPQGQWRPLSSFPVRSQSGQRSASHYDASLAQFDVDHSARYRPRDGKTFCNIFCWDVTAAMGAEMPHWLTREGAPTWPSSIAHETSANKLADLLPAWGWKDCNEAHAIVMAAGGHPVVALWKNPHGHGHMGMLEPLPRDIIPEIAMAGLVCGRHIPLPNAFGGRVVTWWWDD
jgi:hypothetical protein